MRALKIHVTLLLVLLSAGCRWQVGKDGDPTPTPSPTPSPTPTPIINLGTPTATDSSDTGEVSAATQVAAAGAEFFEAATLEAAAETSSARSALSRALQSPAEAAGHVRSAKKSLARAANAYGKAEASVFLVDPESEDELRAQPDPLHAGVPGARDEVVAGLCASLGCLEGLLSRPVTSESAARLIAEAQNVGTKITRLEAGLRGMSDAWRPDDKGNFRSKFFLPSGEGAVARLFQGALAMTGDVLPGLVSGAADTAEVTARLAAVKELYAGGGEAPPGSPSLQNLVAGVSPLQAALARASLARAVALAGVLELDPGNRNLRGELIASLEDTTRQLTLAAQSLGISVITEE